MRENFDFVVIGAGSAGAVIAARLSEDPSCLVALIEVGERPPDLELMPVACAAMQKNPATDWMYTADPGRAGLGLIGRRVPVPRGKMLGGSSGLNYMAYVRGHPGDFDSWEQGGATGWSYADVLPYFRKSEGLEMCEQIVIDPEAHSTTGPLGVSVRSPVLDGATEFVTAAEASGIPRGDYNGRNRGGAAGVVSLLQTSTRKGKRSSTYRAFLEGEAEQRTNLTIIAGAQATGIVLEKSSGETRSQGRSLSSLGRQQPHGVRNQGGDLERRRGRFAASPYAVRHRPQKGAGGSRHCLLPGFAARREAFEGPYSGSVALPLVRRGSANE